MILWEWLLFNFLLHFYGPLRKDGVQPMRRRSLFSVSKRWWPVYPTWQERARRQEASWLCDLVVESDRPARSEQCYSQWLSSPILTGNGSPVKYCRGLPVCEFSEYRESLFYFPYSLDCTTCIGVKAARQKVRLLKSSEVGPKKPLLYLKWRVACCYVLYGIGKVSQQHFWVN